jgi:hypothetical protein
VSARSSVDFELTDAYLLSNLNTRSLWQVGLAILLFSGSRQAVQALDDTLSNRETAAGHYLQVASLADLMADVSEKAAVIVPEAERARFKAVLTKELDIAALTSAMRSSLVRIFTADELEAMAQFYGSPAGKSILRKFGAYMADVMPIIQTEVIRAATRAAERSRPSGNADAAPTAAANRPLHP